jgi:hypothetical protein
MIASNTGHLSALRGMARWTIDEGHIDEDDNLTIGVRAPARRKLLATAGGQAKPPISRLGLPEDDLLRFHT